ncbi:MAG: helix-turn-helix domain-containing protein [Clostridia bacterium]|nr:helix-turn-helix domain-containing protein [Clostridia bacterium]
MSDVHNEKLHSGFIQIPYEFFQESEGRISGRVETLLRGVIFGFSLGTNACRFSYTAFEQYINRSRATVAHAVKGMRERSSDVEITRKGGQASEYRYVGEVVRKKKHVRVPIFLFYELFDMPKGKNGEFEERLLTGTELLVYALILTHSMKNKNTGFFESSSSSIANMLNCSVRSVERAIYALMKSGLISRPKKGKNRYSGISTYRADVNLYKMLWKKNNPNDKKEEKAAKKAAQDKVQPKSTTADDLNARADRERYYTHTRERAQAAVGRNMAKANAIPGFTDVLQKLRKMEYAIAHAELKEPDKLPALRAEGQALEFERARLLRTVGLSPADLQVQHRCEKCKDTGYQKDGSMCTCYKTAPPGGAP